MRQVDEIKKNVRISSVENETFDGFVGVIAMPTWVGTYICSWGAGWEHVSIRPFKKNVTPSWDDMCRIKDIFWNEDEAVIQVHPDKDNYVDFMENCLHLWKCTYKEMVLPPYCLVGPKRGQSMSELKKDIKAAYEAAGEEYDD